MQAPVDEEFCDAEEARWLWAQRHLLAPRDRQVLELRAQGRSLAEAAGELGVTYKAAENALGRARGRMRAVLAGAGAALAGLLGWRPRRPPAAAVAAGPIVALAAAVLLLPVTRSPAEAPAVPPPASRGEPLTRPEPASGSAVPGPSAAGPPSPAPPLELMPPQPSPIAADSPEQQAPVPVGTTPTVQLGGLQVGAGGAERHQSEPITETALQCLRDGPVLELSPSGSTIGCPE